MAKQSNTIHVNGVNGGDSHYTTPDVFTTSKGEKVKIVGLNQSRFETLQNAGSMPSIPYRLMETELGEPQKEELTEGGLQNDEEREQWREYREKIRAIEEKRARNILRYVYDDGIIVDGSKMDEWKQEEEEIYEVDLPTNRIDLKVAYINAKVIGNADDLAEIMAGVMERTGIPAHMLDEVRDSFRNTVRQNPTPEAESTEGQMALE